MSDITPALEAILESTRVLPDPTKSWVSSFPYLPDFQRQLEEATPEDAHEVNFEFTGDPIWGGTLTSRDPWPSGKKPANWGHWLPKDLAARAWQLRRAQVAANLGLPRSAAYDGSLIEKYGEPTGIRILGFDGVATPRP